MKTTIHSFLSILLGLIIIFLVGSCAGSREFLSSDFEKELMQRRTLENLEGKEEFLITDKQVKPLKNREYYWYRAGKVNRSEGNYAGKLLDGVYTRFYEDHSIREKGDFKNGIKTGTWLHWYPNGEISKKESFNNDGNLHGYYAVLDENGDLVSRGYYRNGQKQGRWVDYTNQDTLYYKRGEIKKSKIRDGLLNRIFKKKDSLSIDTEKLKDTLRPGFFKRLFQKGDQEKTKKEKGKNSIKKLPEKSKNSKKSGKEGFLYKLFKKKPEQEKDDA